ncbi:PPOX class F420-dependent oxidoreductase [Haloechinothrix halophila]|uniref:PPOX class F420-dependent oxidoreductase n=1 Tax=Haloechinothrix halophila TaxID=1069073 RepID=UPI0004120EBC|nr:PPOX class F420-dependent oxidoreductase [Haloechinothrix halophila]
MSTALRRLADEKYVQLTTFRRNGTPVPTPIWAVADDGELFVWTERNSGKIKRIRNNPRVEVTACDLRGKRTHGEKVSGTARLLDDAETDRVRKLLGRKYGVLGFLGVVGSIVRGGKKRTIGVGITLED